MVRMANHTRLPATSRSGPGFFDAARFDFLDILVLTWPARLYNVGLRFLEVAASISVQS